MCHSSEKLSVIPSPLLPVKLTDTWCHCETGDFILNYRREIPFIIKHFQKCFELKSKTHTNSLLHTTAYYVLDNQCDMDLYYGQFNTNERNR
eukprot:UN22000